MLFRKGFTSIGRMACGFLAGFSVLAAVAATDGTWASATAGGNWSDTTKWMGGILPGDGGVANFNFTAWDFNIVATGVETTLGGFAFTSTAPRDKEVIFENGTFHLVAPARIELAGGNFAVYGGTIDCAGDLVFSGSSMSRFRLTGNQSIAGRTIISNMYVRIQKDASLGPAPATLRADAVILAGGALQNGQNFSSVSATRGITLTEEGGYLMAGYLAPASLTINSPITGPGALGITYENSPVVLANPANDWSGDTRVGVYGPGWGTAVTEFWLQLGADEVIPHGEGKGQLFLGPCQTFCNGRIFCNEPAAPSATLEMSGHEETVNALQGGVRAYLSSTNGPARLILASDADSAYAGTVKTDVTVVKRGTGTLRLNGAYVHGGVDLEAGTLVVGPGNVFADATVNLKGGDVSVVPSGGCYEWCGNSGSSTETFNAWYAYPRYGERVSRFGSTSRARYRSRWYVPEAGTYSFMASYGGRAVLWIDGAQVISNDNVSAVAKVVQDVPLSAGWHDVEQLFERTTMDVAYNNMLASGIMYDSANGAFSTDEEKLRARSFADEDATNVVAAGYAYPQRGHFHLGADTTLSVAADAEPYVFGGVLTTDPANPHTLTVSLPSGGPLVVGCDNQSTPALIGEGVTIQSPGGIVLTNNVVLQTAPGPDVTIAPGATVVHDYAGALTGTITLTDKDLHVISEGTGDGTIVVPTGRKAVFDTVSLVDGAFVDPATGTRTYANAVVLEGGTLEFTGAGEITFTGAVSGYGTVSRTGSGSVALANAGGLTSGATVVISGGSVRVPAGGSLGAATIKTSGGRLANVPDGQVTIPNPVVANGGGIDVLGTNGVIELSGAITHQANISKWGEGTLRLTGSDANALRMHIRGGTVVCAKDDGVPAFEVFIGFEAGCTIRLEGDGQAKPNTSYITFDGGTLDVNGHDMTLLFVQTRTTLGTIVNNGAAAATLTCAGTGSGIHPFHGTIANGTAPLFFVYGGAETYDFSGAKLANTGLAVTNGTVLFAGAETAKGQLLRFQPTAARPAASGAPNYGGSGVQIAEFHVLLGGTPVAWPAGTTAWSSKPAQTAGEGAPKTIDGSSSTKWYSNDNNYKPLIIDCHEDISFDAYQFQTANDAIGRDPISWTVSVGTVSGGVTNWVVIDEQVNVTNHVPLTRYAWADSFSVVKSMRHPVCAPDYALTVSKPATAAFGWMDQTFENLTGDGLIVATNGAVVTIGGASTFTGSIVSEETVHLAYDSATVPGVTGADVGTVIVNDGPDATMTFSSGAWAHAGSWQDGVGTLGLDVQSGATLSAQGTNAAYTGATTVRSGGEIRVAPGTRAQYLRFTIINCTANQGAKNAQLSEIQLVGMGEGLTWPEGTTATSQGDNKRETNPESAAQLIDGTVNTKCYWGGLVYPVNITLPEPISFEGYRWYTANDEMDKRNPVSWRFEASMDGVTWTLIDEQTNCETVTTTKTLAYTFCVVDDVDLVFNALGDASPLALEAGSTCTVAYVEETVGALSGAGTLALRADAYVRLNTAADSAFSGDIVGAGTLAKSGSATQTVSGVVNLTGTLVVEAGILDLTGATLTGVTNIVLRGGALVGAATVNGDLTVISEGGAYGASLAVSGRLTLVGTPTIWTGFAGSMVARTAFTFGSTDAASREAFAAAACAEELGRRWIFSAKASETSMRWTVSPGGTYIYFR